MEHEESVVGRSSGGRCLAGQKAKAEWLCGENRCVWVAYDVDEPAYALAWGPPVRPSCFWKQGVFGRWKLVCP